MVVVGKSDNTLFRSIRSPTIIPGSGGSGWMQMYVNEFRSIPPEKYGECNDHGFAPSPHPGPGGGGGQTDQIKYK